MNPANFSPFCVCIFAEWGNWGPEGESNSIISFIFPEFELAVIPCQLPANEQII